MNKDSQYRTNKTLYKVKIANKTKEISSLSAKLLEILCKLV